MTERLLQAARSNLEVRVTLTRCEHKCCGGGWHLRSNTDTYQGKVLSFNRGTFLLQIGNAAGKMAEVLAQVEHLTAVSIVD